MKKDLITNTDKVSWSRSIRFGKINIRFGIHKTTDTSSFFIEKNKKTDDRVIIHQQIFQKISNGTKIRLAHHSRMQILKKV